MVVTQDVGAPASRRKSPIIEPGWHRGKSPANAGRTYPAEPLRPEEAIALVRALPRRGPSGLRNRALVVVMWRAGLRVAEALALYPKDLDHRDCTISVLHGKGDKRRTVAIDPGGMATIERWLEVRRGLGVTARSPLFCTISADCRGRPLHSAYVRGMVKHYAARAGLVRRVHPHALRHTYAYELAMEGKPIHLIKQALGHSSLETTSRYVSHLAPRELADALRDRKWPEGL